jgi:lysophospholipase L1-like esterase
VEESVHKISEPARPRIESSPARKLGPVRKRHPFAKRSVTILGDSVIRDIRGRRMQEVLHNKASVFVKPNPGATVEDMRDFARPALRRDPSLVILHSGTNSLRDEGKSAMQIARDIVQLAESSKTATNDVAISSLVIRGDVLQEKGNQVNLHLKELCTSRNLWLIDNSNINLGDLRDDVHLNPGGTVKLADNFLQAINL